MSNRLWKILASLKLTVVLLVLSTLLVFLGTLAQVHEGLWEAQTRWFKSYIILKRSGDAWWVPPVFTGGYTLGFSLLINLIAAHLQRFQLKWSKAGIHLTHAGIIILLLGQLATDLLSRESFISFMEGETRADSESHRDIELVAFMPSDQSGKERVVSFLEPALIAGKELANSELPFRIKVLEQGPNCEVYSHASLKEAASMQMTALGMLESRYSSAEAIPSEAERAMENDGRMAVWRTVLQEFGEKDPDIVSAAKKIAADPSRESKFRERIKTAFREQMLRSFQMIPPMEAASSQALARKYTASQLAAGKPLPLDALPSCASQGAGMNALLNPLPPAHGMDQRNDPYTKVEILAKDGSLGTWVFSPWFKAQEVSVEGKTFRISLRRQIYQQPFSLTLLKTTNDVYPGTDIPKNFQSRVRLEHPAKSEKREIDISMNNPLRYDGLTFYQHQMGRRDLNGGKGTSSLQVVKNPSWITPYLGCAIVSFGMLWQFLYHLVGFLSKPRKTQPAGTREESTDNSAAATP
jgi:hypothetical protein